MKRLTRVMDARQLRITMTLITRLFRDFDVVQHHRVAESLVESKEKHEMEKHIHTFEEYVLEAILPALAVAPLPVVSGQLQQLRDPVIIARTRVSSSYYAVHSTDVVTARDYPPNSYFYSSCYHQGSDDITTFWG